MELQRKKRAEVAGAQTFGSPLAQIWAASGATGTRSGFHVGWEALQVEASRLHHCTGPTDIVLFSITVS